MAAVTEVRVPDIGDFEDVPVIEILVKPGDTVAPEDPLVTLESDKATMDVPSPSAGTVKEVLVSVGDKVAEGTPIVTLDAGEGEGEGEGEGGADGGGDGGGGGGDEAAATQEEPPAVEEESSEEAGETTADETQPAGDGAAGDEAEGDEAAGDGDQDRQTPQDTAAGAPEAVGYGDTDAGADGAGAGAPVHASPAVRRLAREHGVDLRALTGTGRKGRITKEDVERARSAPTPAAAPAGGDAGLGLAPWPQIDFTKFGEVERRPLSRIAKISGPNLARNWVRIPHVTHHDEADITELEAFRKRINAEQDVKVTMVALLLKACVASLKAFPEFNASLDGDDLVLKRYYHLGFAADTPNGLVVPVIRDVDGKGLLEIAAELRDLSAKARAGKLMPAQMQGGTFTISSLGGIGGTGFTPIVNAPEVAILGVTRSAMKPVWDGQAFVPRLMVPLSLSYDHRVIDGATAARFMVHLTGVLSDLRRVLL